LIFPEKNIRDQNVDSHGFTKEAAVTSDQLLKIVEQYSRESAAEYGDIKVTRIQDQKTMFIEQIGDSGRSIMMSAYKVDGATYWAGYSSRSQTVYVSQAAPILSGEATLGTNGIEKGDEKWKTT